MYCLCRALDFQTLVKLSGVQLHLAPFELLRVNAVSLWRNPLTSFGLLSTFHSFGIFELKPVFHIDISRVVHSFAAKKMYYFFANCYELGWDQGRTEVLYVR